MSKKEKTEIEEIQEPEKTTETEQEKTEPEKTTDGIDDIATLTIDNVPEVSESVEELNNTIVDDTGTEFDTSIHASTPDGSPAYKKNGTTFKMKRGRKKGGASSLNACQNNNIDETKNQAEIAAASGKTLSMVYFSFGRILAGDDFLPESKTEQEHVENLIANYLQSTDKPDLPPGWALVLGLSAHGFSKMQKPKAKTRLQRIASKIKGIFIKNRAPVEGPKEPSEKEAQIA